MLYTHTTKRIVYLQMFHPNDRKISTVILATISRQVNWRCLRCNVYFFITFMKNQSRNL